MSKKLWQKALFVAFPPGGCDSNTINTALEEELSSGTIYANIMNNTDGDIVVQISNTEDSKYCSLILTANDIVYFNRQQIKGINNNAKYCFMALALAFGARRNSKGLTDTDLVSLTDGSIDNVPWVPFTTQANALVKNLSFVCSYAKEKQLTPIGEIHDFFCDGLDMNSWRYVSEKNDLKDLKIREADSYNETEKDRIKNNSLVEGFLPTPEDDACVARIYNWITKKGYAPSFFFYGPAGTGKSEVGKYFSKVTGIPYTFVTCSAMTNEADLRGKPNKLSQNGAIIKFANRLIDNFWKRKIETSDIDSDEIQYSDTELVLACKYGWIIEIQEAAHIIDAGTLGFLNCTLDTNRVLTLPNGKQIKLHPNTTFIFTSNVEYEGCNPFNLSLLSRMCYTRRFDKMPLNAQVERVMSVTEYDNREDVKKVVKAIEELNNIIIDNDITQGICDLRSAINCITDYQICGGSLRQSAKLTIEDKVSLESGYEEEIRLKLDSILGLI